MLSRKAVITIMLGACGSVAGWNALIPQPVPSFGNWQIWPMRAQYSDDEPPVIEMPWRPNLLR
jgi:hypothetical protein